MSTAPPEAGMRIAELGGLSVAKVRAIVAVSDGEAGSPPRGGQVAGLDALEVPASPAPQDGSLANLAAAPRTLAPVDALAERRGWHAPADGAEFARVVEILDALGELDQHHFADQLDAYADAAERAATADTELPRSPAGAVGRRGRPGRSTAVGTTPTDPFDRYGRNDAPRGRRRKREGAVHRVHPLPHSWAGARYERSTSTRSRSRTGSAF